jgi:hypothetical protein
MPPPRKANYALHPAYRLSPVALGLSPLVLIKIIKNVFPVSRKAGMKLQYNLDDVNQQQSSPHVLYCTWYYNSSHPAPTPHPSHNTPSW